MYCIGKEFYFLVLYNLWDLFVGYFCMCVYGYNYIVMLEFVFEELDVIGFIVDFKELNVLWDWIDDNLDYCYLNDVFDYLNVMIEWFCKVIYDWCKECWY